MDITHFSPKHFGYSMQADMFERDKTRYFNPFDFAAKQEDKACALCGKVERMKRKQKYCLACSLIPPKKRKEMMEGKQ